VGKILFARRRHNNSDRLIVGFWLVMLQLLVKKRTRELAGRNEMLRLAQEGLEERVAQRTIELTNINAALHKEINERRQAEEELRRARRAVVLTLKSRNSWDGLQMRTERLWKISFVERIYGTGRARGEGLGWSKALHPDDLEHTAQVWRNALATRITMRRNTEYADMTVLPALPGPWRSRLEDDGTIREWVGTCIDITERKRTEEALKQQTKELQRLAGTLEQRVRDRTEELEKANEGLRRLSSKLLLPRRGEKKDCRRNS